MSIDRETIVWDLLESLPEAKAILLNHGCDVDEECTNEALESTLEAAEGICHLDDMEGLLQELQALHGATAAGSRGARVAS